MRFYTILLLTFFMSLGWSTAYAACLPGVPCIVAKNSEDNKPKSDSGTCDADFMNQLQARAFLEAEREAVAAGVAIRKPESVLELSCADQLTNVLGGGSYSCQAMNDLHFAARCNNVKMDDYFFTFEDLASGDPRKYPAGMQCGGTQSQQAYIDLADNKDGAYVDFDAVQTQLKRFDPAQRCGNAIVTGVTYVYEKSKEPLQYARTYDVICMNPACHYSTEERKCIK